MRTWLLWIATSALFACAGDDLRLPRLTPPPDPADNPSSEAKIALGRHLFYDPRLSRNGDVSCASCHVQAHAFSDPRPRSLGTTGAHTSRNAQSIVNVGYAASLTWANSVLTTLERQALVPLFADRPIELGMAGRDAVLLARLAAESRYARLFADAYPAHEAPLRLEHVLQALAAFQRDLRSLEADYDHYLAGDRDALSDGAQRGLTLFASERLGCTHCHGGPLLSSAMTLPEQGPAPMRFENNGLYAAYPHDDRGLRDLTERAEDDGFFKPPSLRNVEVTAPYMHDGSLATLDAVLDHYARGGAPHPRKSARVRGFTLTPSERADLLAFLRALTDPRVLSEPRWSDPWRAAR